MSNSFMAGTFVIRSVLTTRSGFPKACAAKKAGARKIAFRALNCRKQFEKKVPLVFWAPMNSRATNR
jgi:hypothetical protein